MTVREVEPRVRQLAIVEELQQGLVEQWAPAGVAQAEGEQARVARRATWVRAQWAPALFLGQLAPVAPELAPVTVEEPQEAVPAAAPEAGRLAVVEPVALGLGALGPAHLALVELVLVPLSSRVVEVVNGCGYG